MEINTLQDDKLNTVGKRIEFVVQKIDSKKKDAAKNIGVTPTTISRWINGEVTPDQKNLDKMSDLSGIPVNWIVMKPETEKTLPSKSLFDRFVIIKQVRGRASAGGGLEPDNMVESEFVFRKDWIQQKGTLERMILIRVEGDSMYPELKSGDLVLVDTERNYLGPSTSLYAITYQGEVMIKGLEEIPKPKDGPEEITIVSINKERYSPRTVLKSSIIINGRAIWVGHEL